MHVKERRMPLYLYRWLDGGLSVVLADNAEQAVLRLEEEGGAGEGEGIERVLPEKLKESHRFHAHFELVGATEEIPELLNPEDLLKLDGGWFGPDVEHHLQELYPRIWEVARRETNLVEGISLLGSGMPVSEIYAMYDEALVAEKTNSPLPEPGRRPTSLPLTMRALEIFNRQRDKFERKFGREFGAGDLIFIDPDQPTPQRIIDAEPASLWLQLLAGMEEAGISEAVRYATKRTGRAKIETHERDLAPAESVAEWDAAIAEFEQRRAKEQTSRKSRRHPRPLPMKLNKKGEKAIPLTPELIEMFKLQKQRFVEKFGREPGPHDPIFFDEKADAPQYRKQAEVSAKFDEMLDRAQAAGVDPAKIYASRKTGRMVTEHNMKYLTREDIDEWEAAIDEYHEKIKPGIQ
jgi:hypothetical protein